METYIDKKTGKEIMHMKVVNSTRTENNPLPVLTPINQQNSGSAFQRSRSSHHLQRQWYVCNTSRVECWVVAYMVESSTLDR